MSPRLKSTAPHAARSALAPHRLAGAKPVACCRPTSTTGSPASTTARISASDEGALFRAISGAPANHEGGSHPAVADSSLVDTVLRIFDDIEENLQTSLDIEKKAEANRGTRSQSRQRRGV